MIQKEMMTICLNTQDNVAVALSALAPGTLVSEQGLVSRRQIPAGHKVSLRVIHANEAIRKYGQIIGFASVEIQPGDHVHTHNMAMGDFTRDYAFGEDVRETEPVPPGSQATFEGIVRENGRVGTRNYIGVLVTVNCSASVAHFIAEAFTDDVLAEFSHVDGVVSLGHGTGCGMGSDGDGFRLLQRTLAGYARHANFAGILIVGLGCEVNRIDALMENMNLEHGPLLQSVTIQDDGGTTETVRRGIGIIREMLPQADSVRRRPVSAGTIVLGLECGGSDAYSGISANPALGAAADLLVRHGGTAILSETPEIYGAEHLLTRRAAGREVGEKLVERIKWWEDYTARLGGKIDNNPSPGNKEGGLTTILEKSLGAVAKGGTTNLIGVYGFAEPVVERGLVFMDTPGYDAVSVTGMIAGGATIIGFTTGRGSVSGFKPVPTIKLATNTTMYERLKEDMDVNCGLIVDGETTIEEMGALIFGLILETASGKRTRSELLGFGDHEFVPWQIGAVM